MWDTLPRHLLVLVARALQPSPFKMPKPPLRTVAAFKAEEREEGRSLATKRAKATRRSINKSWCQLKTESEAAWKPAAAMAAVCRDWCSAAYEAVDCPPAWITLSKALNPPRLWRSAQITSLCLLVPAMELDPCRGVEAWQREIHEKLHDLYPKLQDTQLHWQVRSQMLSLDYQTTLDPH